MWDIANKAREEWESEAGSRAAQAQTSSTADTNVLVAAVGIGSGLKVIIFIYHTRSTHIIFLKRFLILGLQINSVPFFAFKSDKKGTELICRANNLHTRDFKLNFQTDPVQMGSSGVSPGPAGMMVGRPGSQPGAGGQGPLGNPQSKFSHSLLNNIKN